MTHLDRRYLAAVARIVVPESRPEEALRRWVTPASYARWPEAERPVRLEEDRAWVRRRVAWWRENPHLLRLYHLLTTPRGWVRRRWPKVVDKLYRLR